MDIRLDFDIPHGPNWTPFGRILAHMGPSFHPSFDGAHGRMSALSNPPTPSGSRRREGEAWTPLEDTEPKRERPVGQGEQVPKPTTDGATMIFIELRSSKPFITAKGSRDDHFVHSLSFRGTPRKSSISCVTSCIYRRVPW